MAYYWERGDLVNLAEVGGGLIRTATRPLPGEPDLPFLVALAAILGGKDEELARSALEEVQFEPDAVARRLAELIRLLGKPTALTGSGGSESGMRRLPSAAASGGSESGARRLPAERGHPVDADRGRTGAAEALADIGGT